MPSPESQRRGFRFSLRSLLFLVTFVAVLLAFYKTRGRDAAQRIVENLWPEYVTSQQGPDGKTYRSGHVYCPWLLGAGFHAGPPVLPLSAVAVVIYIIRSRRAPSFLLLHALGVIVVSAYVLLFFGANLLRHWNLFPHLPRIPLPNFWYFGPYYLFTMLTGSVAALVECQLKRLPWAAVWMSLAALLCSFLFFGLLSGLYRMEAGG